MSTVPTDVNRAVKPISLRVLRGCGCLAWIAVAFSAINLIFALRYRAIDIGAIVLGVAALFWFDLISHMERLHREPNLDEIIADAQQSTYRSKSTERAFKLVGCYLPLVVIGVAAVQMLFIGETRAVTTVAINSPVFLGLLLLFWRRRYRELRFQQAQSARDRLADLLFEHSRLANCGSSDDRLATLPRTFFLYLRPFAITGALKAVPADSLLSSAVDLEVRLADSLAAWGPLIALGSPGEARGAGRKQVTEADWRAAIEYALDAATKIIVLPGYQSGIIWEIERLLQKSLSNKTIFIQPPNVALFGAEWQDRTRAAMHAMKLPWAASLYKQYVLFTVSTNGDVMHSEYFGRSAGFRQVRRKLKPFLKNVPRLESY